MVTTGVEEPAQTVPVRNLRAGPNPTRGATRISYTLPGSGFVDCSVYDGTGRQVADLAHGRQPAGEHSLFWDSSGAQPGVYVVRLSGAVRGSVRVVKAD